MIATPFLTQLDTRAAVKGSRDPLGVLSIWPKLGRHVVGNLTTVSNSIRDFTVLLLGHYFAERVGEEGGGEGDVSTFLKWEQLAAYARAHVNREDGFRGIERVQQRLAEGDRVRLGTDGEAQILGNQKTYGLWGLYTVPAKASGLLAGDPTRLTAEASKVVKESLLPAMESAETQVVERLRSKEWRLDLRNSSRDAMVLRSVARTLKSIRAPERDLYREHLLYGGPAGRDTEG